MDVALEQVVTISRFDAALHLLVESYALPLEISLAFAVNLSVLVSESIQLQYRFGHGEPQLMKLQPFHDGGWRTLKLWSWGGDLDDDEPHGDNVHDQSTGADFQWAPTLAWFALPSDGFIRSTLAPLGRLLRRVRFSTLLPGAMVYYHDDSGKFDSIARVHFPVITNSRAELLLGGHQGTVQPGSCFIADFNVPHTLWNHGEEPRTCFVLALWQRA